MGGIYTINPQDGLIDPSEGKTPVVHDIEDAVEVQSTTVDPETIRGELLEKMEELKHLFAKQSNDGANVLNDILLLLIALTESAQGMAMAQSASIHVLTQLQSKYVELQQQIPYITTATKWLTGEDNKEARTNANSKLNIYMEMVRTNKSLIEDKMKEFNSRLSSTQQFGDSVSDQFTAILQSISSILSLLFRG